MNLKIKSKAGDVFHMALSGRISQTSEDVRNDGFAELLGDANFNKTVILSLEETDFIDSSGIGWLLATDKKFKQSGGKLILHSLPIDVQHVFGLMKLNKVLHVASDAEQATASASEESHE